MVRFRKKSITFLKYISPTVILVFFICIILTGCTESIRNKVVIIDEEIEYENQINKDINEDFNIKKIYKYKTDEILNDSDGASIDSFGWADQDDIIILKDRKDLYKTNYRYKFSNPISNNNMINMSLLSPDGSILCYSTQNKKGTKVYLLNINKEKTQLIYNFQASSLLKWSAHSQYISFVTQENNEKYLVVYDVLSNTINKTKIITKDPGDYYFIQVIISDDGKKASYVYFSDQTYFFYHADIGNDTIYIDAADAIKLTSNITGKFHLDENSMFFLDGFGTLYKYEHSTKVISKIIENTVSFEISQDAKYIAFFEHTMKYVDAYVGKLTDYGIENKKLIYKNIMPMDVKWSSDNKKILIEGIEYNNKLNKYMDNDYQYTENTYINARSTIIIEFDDKLQSEPTVK